MAKRTHADAILPQEDTTIDTKSAARIARLTAYFGKLNTQRLPELPEPPPGQEPLPPITDELPDDWLETVWTRCRYNAKTRKIAFALTMEDMHTLAKWANGACEITGIPFSRQKVNGARLPPYYPSIDRIDCDQGYDEHNCRLVCSVVNIAMHEWGDEVIFTLMNARNRSPQLPFETMKCFNAEHPKFPR